MIFQVLGCSGSESDRTHPCSFLIGTSVLVDMGSAASRLTLEEQTRVRDIFLSHAHLDHTKDLAFFVENIFGKSSGPINVRSVPDTLKKVQDHLLNDQIWPDFTHLPTQADSILRFAPFEAETKFRAGELDVYAVPVNHPGGCVGLFFRSSTGTILYSGDTGPTQALWREVNRRKGEMKAILLECSFPNRLQKLAELSGHHTPASLAQEIQLIEASEVPIYAYHIKAPYRDETVRELDQIADGRIRILEPGMRIEF